VSVGDSVFVSGNVVVHQYVRIGELAMIGGLARVSKDVPPFMLVVGSHVRSVNMVGLRRAGMSAERRAQVRRAYGVLYRAGLATSHAVALLRQEPPSKEIDAIIAFISESTRGICAAAHRAATRQPEPEGV
jgi:UDP-N-acetylglucosamine acyltransferase